VAALRQPVHERFTIADAADAGALRRAVGGYADRAPPAAGRGRGLAELAATELATNLLRHAKPGGWVLTRPIPPSGIELIAVDRGPGIADVAAAVAGRTPNPRGLGSGLAAVHRASSAFDIHTVPGVGTTVAAVVDLDGTVGWPSHGPLTWAGVSIGVAEVCGDAWAVTEVDGGLAVAVVDGLGHGPKASVAADAALDAFAAAPTDLAGFPERANAAMRATRGGVAAVCHLRPADGELDHLAVGNVSGRIVDGTGQRGLPFHAGALGLAARPRRTAPATYPFPPGATLVLWTDGLRSRVDVSRVDGLFAHHPAVAAATLHRDHTRERDDATVLVVQHREPS
jgi:anti-sigma regulatory factor (Ser/Thr protein kinase)